MIAALLPAPDRWSWFQRDIYDTVVFVMEAIWDSWSTQSGSEGGESWGGEDSDTAAVKEAPNRPGCKGTPKCTYCRRRKVKVISCVWSGLIVAV
jgi:hypothetical protein